MRYLHNGKILQADEESIKMKSRYIAVKLWSEPLQAHLWVVADEEDVKAFRSQGITEEIYTADEIQKLNGIDGNSLKALHMIFFDN
jgi:hypothetical protein